MGALRVARRQVLTDLDQSLESEADTLLNGHGLLAVLRKYGRVQIVGSRFLSTMVWRDLDLYLDGSAMTVEDRFRLAYDVAVAIDPHRINYQVHENTPGLPRGVYWGIQTNAISPDTWKVDLWAFGSEQFDEYAANSEKLKARITEDARLSILDIKSAVWSHPRYRRDFTSMDIYAAVLDNGVMGIDEFAHWLKAAKELEITGILGDGNIQTRL